MVNETVDDVFGNQRPPDITLRVLEGTLAPALINASRHAEMLVAGSRGLGSIAGLLLGSVSAQVAEHARAQSWLSRRIHDESSPA